jgi:hypothetical protein
MFSRIHTFTLAILIASLSIISTQSLAQGALLINCEHSDWTGHRIGYSTNGERESVTNYISHYGPMIIFKSPYPKRGESATLVYTFPDGGIRGSNEASVLYSDYGGDPYIVIEAMDGNLVAIHSFNLRTGQATLTTPKAFLGFYVDAYVTDNCENTFVPK